VSNGVRYHVAKYENIDNLQQQERIRTWFVVINVGHLGKSCHAGESQQNGEPEKYDGIEPYPDGVHVGEEQMMG